MSEYTIKPNGFGHFIYGPEGHKFAGLPYRNDAEAIVAELNRLASTLAACKQAGFLDEAGEVVDLKAEGLGWDDRVAEATQVGGVVDCSGDRPVVRKVLGTLPVMKDGCILGNKAVFYVRHASVRRAEDGHITRPLVTQKTNDCAWISERAYSTRDAALTASKGAANAK